jgi:ABC-type branched-subunit amino acid transport system ATPase component/branched-subunit amino acid ABC-type transport system permease component
MLPFIVVGLATGIVYSLAGTGLVLTFKTSGVFNFGQGALATVSAYLFYALQTQHGVPWGWAAVISVLLAGPLMGLGMAELAKAVASKSLAVNIGSTVGILLVVEAGVELIYGTVTTRNVPIFFGSGSVELFGVAVKWFDIITFIFGIVVTALLTVYLRATRMGMAMRAVVDDAPLLDTSGISPGRVRRAAWVIGSTLAAASGVLFVPLLPLDPLQLTLLVVSAFGAAAIGAFRSLTLTFLGGLIIGVAASLLTRYATSNALAGLAPSLPFLVLFFLLLVYPSRRGLPKIAETTARLTAPWKTPTKLNFGMGAVLLIALCFVPEFTGLQLSNWTMALATTIVFLSLSLLVRTAGQVSLCQVSFMAIGAAAFSHLSTGLHLPWVLALIVAGLIAMPIGALLAIPAIRLSGLYLALATFGFGILLEYLFYSQTYMFGYNGVGLVEPRPHLSFLTLDSDTGFYYVVLFCTLLAVALLVGIDRSRMGRLLRGIADAPTAMQASGTSVTVTRVLVFCVSVFLAAVGGALAGAAQSTVSSDSYSPITSLTYLAVIVVILAGAPWNAIIAGFTFVLIPAYFPGATVSYVLQIVFGAGLVLQALQPDSMQHLPPALTKALDRVFRPQKSETALRAAQAREISELRSQAEKGLGSSATRVQQGSLELSEVRVQFGGLVAVQNASLIAPTGQITGLIGPNGAGKTTTFNVCSGFQHPVHGRVLIDGRNVTRLGPAARARVGLGRTFQHLELFDSLSVRENVMLGAEGRFARANPARHLFAGPDQHRTSITNTAAAIELCELTELADSPVATLATGQRRLADLARCLAGNPRILLLDEPSSGLDRVETRRFADILRRVIVERGVGILIVEHDLSLVLDVCNSIYVLDFGEMLFQGTPEEVVASPVVQAAYLGEPASEANGTGAKVLSSADSVQP